MARSRDTERCTGCGPPEAIRNVVAQMQAGEENRLLYVGMTRAKSHMVLSYSTNDKRRPGPWARLIAQQLVEPRDNRDRRFVPDQRALRSDAGAAAGRCATGERLCGPLAAAGSARLYCIDHRHQRVCAMPEQVFSVPVYRLGGRIDRFVDIDRLAAGRHMANWKPAKSARRFTRSSPECMSIAGGRVR